MVSSISQITGTGVNQSRADVSANCLSFEKNWMEQ